MASAKKIGVFSFGRFQAVLGALIGLICGNLYSFAGLIIDVLVNGRLLSAAQMSTPGISFGTVLAFMAVIGMTVIFAAFGFVWGMVEAVLYNLFANRFGGMKIDIEEKGYVQQKLLLTNVFIK